MFTSIDTNASKSTLKKPVNFRIPKMKRCVEPKKQETFHYEPMPFRSKKLDPVNIPIQNHNTILRLSIDTGAWISVLYPNKLNGYTTIDVNKSINIKGIVQKKIHKIWGSNYCWNFSRGFNNPTRISHHKKWPKFGHWRHTGT